MAPIFCDHFEIERPMLAHATSGPYKGRALDHNDLNLYCTLLPPVGPVTFFLFPPVESWDDVTHDRTPKGGPFEGQQLLYWLERHADHVELHFDEHGSALQRAHEFAKTYVPPVPELKGSDYECVPAAQIADEFGWREITDEKGRVWRYRQQPKGQTDWIGPGLPPGVTRFVVLYAEDLEDLKQRLSDELD
jgi:hypothetical protein